MKRNPRKYIYHNLAGCDCQLVSAVNAYYYLTGKTITNKRYMRMAEQYHCITGACIDIESAYKELGIEVKKQYREYDLKYKRKFPLPLEVRVFHPDYGFHSVLIVEYNKPTHSFRVMNFELETSTENWIFVERFFPWVRPEKEWLNARNKDEKERPYSREKFTFQLLGIK